jgi:murein DD-endopeptidase MepM/ murein hydrolase activator NlpD
MRNLQNTNSKLGLITHISYLTFFFLLLSYLIPHISYFNFASAQSITDLQSKIDQRSEDIKALEKEIASYQKQINELGTQASSLSSTIKSLELTQKKLAADIKVTENRIIEKNIEIQQLSMQIGDKEEAIVDDRRIISQAFVTMNEQGDRSLPELLLRTSSLSSAWNSLDELNMLQKGLTDRITNLEQVKAGLETNKKATEKAKTDLLKLNDQLKDQRSVVLGTAAEKNALLKETKNDQAAYSKLLVERQKLKEAFEREVTALEDALKIAIDPDSIPHTGQGVLKYPLDSIRITQYFGNTSFATANPQIYKTGTHPGIDFGTSIGTQVHAALSGTVVGSGNMDLAGGGRCRAYGKWIMIKHANGLSTLYAHLSLISVMNGQSVSTGEVIGYSGNTGASTGPHLHFGVYATEGVRITNLTSSSYCSGVIYPLADPKAYLNPLSYL